MAENGPRCVVLDAMGVLFAAADDVAELLVPFVRGAGGDGNAVAAAYLDASLGRIDADAFWQRVGLDAALEGPYLAGHTLVPGARAFLERARDADMPVWCLSNDVARWGAAIRASLDIEHLLRGVIISSDVGVRKPDAGIYERLLEQVGYPATDLLFVDDRPRNVAAAAALGIRAVCFSTEYGYQRLATEIWAPTMEAEVRLA
jgi:HAD superfamily hydrolase (TIGR01509 family)